MVGTSAFVSKWSTVAALDHLLDLRRRLIALLQLHLILNKLLIVLIVAVVARVHIAADSVAGCPDIGSPLRAGQAGSGEVAALLASIRLRILLGADSVVCILIIASCPDVRSKRDSRQSWVGLRSALTDASGGSAHRATADV